MNEMTRIYRQNIINNVYPSDLCKDDIKKGLQLKEDMINAITDEYVNQICPNHQNILDNLANYGISVDDYEKYANGDISISDIKLPENTTCSLYIFPKKKNDNIKSSLKIKGHELENNTWNLINGDIEFNYATNWIFQFKLVITGHNYVNFNLSTSNDMLISGWSNSQLPVNEIQFGDSQFDSENKLKFYISNDIEFSSNASNIYMFMQWLECNDPTYSVDLVSCSLTSV